MMAALYPWLKALHIVAVIAWMAGLLYLPRLFVYHAGAPVASPMAETFKIMERRLYRAIILPAMAAAVLLGGALAGVPGVVDWREHWFPAKLALVAGLLVYTGLLGRWGHDFARDRNRRSARFFRMINEIPALLMIGIVILVVVKPF